MHSLETCCEDVLGRKPNCVLRVVLLEEKKNKLFACLQIIAEGANGPTTLRAHEILLDRNILVIPVSNSARNSALWCLKFAL